MFPNTIGLTEYLLKGYLKNETCANRNDLFLDYLDPWMNGSDKSNFRSVLKLTQSIKGDNKYL